MTRAQTGRPKGSKNKPKDGAAAPQPAQPASKKRTAAGAPVAATAAAAAPSNGGEQPNVSELEGQRQRLAKELTAVEARVGGGPVWIPVLTTFLALLCYFTGRWCCRYTTWRHSTWKTRAPLATLYEVRLPAGLLAGASYWLPFLLGSRQRIYLAS